MCTNHAARNVPACLVALWVFAVMLAPRDVEGSVVSRSREGVTKKCGPPPQGFNNCTTKACENARLVLANMDLCQLPCDDFYKFACGNNKIQRTMPRVSARYGQLDVMRIEVENKMIKLLNKPVTKKDRKSERFAKAIFQSCINVSKIKKRGLEPFEKLVSDLGGWPLVIGRSWDDSKFDWRSLTYKLRDSGQHFDIFFQLAVTPSEVEFDTLNLEIKPLDRIYSDDTSKIKFNTFLTDYVLTRGVDKKHVSDELKKVWDFEEKLNGIISGDSNSGLTSSNMTIEDMNKKFPSVDWKTFLNKILKINPQFEDHDTVKLTFGEKMKSLLEQLGNAEPKTLANYMITRVLYFNWHDLKQATEVVKPTRYAIELGEVIDQEHFCYRSLWSWKSYFGPAIAYMYVTKLFDRQSIPPVKTMINNVRNSFKDILNATSWMDRDTAKVTIEKLDAMKVIVGYTDELMNKTKVEALYSGADFEVGTYLENLYQLQRMEKDIKFSRLRFNKYFMIRKQMGQAIRTNAEYMPDLNSFFIFAAILQGIIYLRERPDYMNYGAIGSIIGHEISHGFDNTGIKYDKTGIKKEWWPKKMTELYEDRTKCFVEQYDKFRQEGTSYKVNGAQTLGENLADHGGALAAYSAYVKMAEQRGETEPGLPGLETLSPRQMFWVSFAQPWCGRFDREEDMKGYQYDPHSLPPFRILGTLQNLEPFSSDFNCPVNSVMNPEKKCRMWQ